MLMSSLWTPRCKRCRKVRKAAVGGDHDVILATKLLADSLIAASVAAAFFGLLDLTLSEAQKARLTHNIISLWNACDDLNRRSSLLGIVSARTHRYIIVSIYAFLILVSLREIYVSRDRYTVVAILTTLIISILIIFLLSRWIERTKDLSVYHFKFYIMAQSLVIPWLLYNVIVKGVPFDNINELVLRTVKMHGFDGFNAILIPAVTLSFIYLILGSVWLLLSVISGFLRFIEFCLRRVAEYSKGPVLGLAALFGAIAALLKSFS